MFAVFAPCLFGSVVPVSINAQSARPTAYFAASFGFGFAKELLQQPRSKSQAHLNGAAHCREPLQPILLVC